MYVSTSTDCMMLRQQREKGTQVLNLQIIRSPLQSGSRLSSYYVLSHGASLPLFVGSFDRGVLQGYQASQVANLEAQIRVRTARNGTSLLLWYTPFARVVGQSLLLYKVSLCFDFRYQSKDPESVLTVSPHSIAEAVHGLLFIAMGRNSKFSFPLTGRKFHPGQDPRHEQQLSKVERILGTSGLVASSSSNTSRLKKLRSRTNPKAIHPPATSAGDYSDLNDIQFSFAEDNTMAQSRYATMRRQASPDILENQHGGDCGPGTQSSVTSSSHTWALKDSASSSTLKSFYDPEKHPLHISQQTSESAIRDMALRKGKPIVITKRPSTGRKGKVSNEPARKDSASMTDSGNTITITAKRPPRLDLSRLFARSNSPLRVAHPIPSSGMESPPAMSYSPEHFNQRPPHFGHGAADSIANSVKSPITPHNANAPEGPAVSIYSNEMPSPTKRSVSKSLEGRPSTASSKAAYQIRFPANMDHSGIKQNIYRPPQGAKHWFDGLLEEEDVSDEELEIESSSIMTRTLSYRDPESENGVEEEYPKVTDQFYPQAEDHFNAPDPAGFIIHRGQTQRESRGEMDRPSSRPSTSKSLRTPVSPVSLAPPLSLMSPVSQRTSRTKHTSRTRESILANSDLGDVSILSLSSSDGDSEDNDSIDSRLPGFRNSIRVSDIDSIVIGEAQAFHISANKSAKIDEDALERRRESVASTGSILSTSTGAETNSIHSSINGPTYLAVPSRESRPRRSGHTRHPTSIPENDDRSITPSASNSRPSSKRSSRPGDAESVKSEPRKMMAVTEEEEALLEMMRSKRAAMAKHSVNDQSRATMTSISSLASSTRRSTRATRPASTSSSILDSFPISRSQRSSLMMGSLNANSQPDLLTAVNASVVSTPSVDRRARERRESSRSRPTLDPRARTDSSHRQRYGSTQNRPSLDSRGSLSSDHRQRSESIQSRARPHSKRTSTTSSISSRLEQTYPAFPPHLSLLPLDINLSPIPSPTYPRKSSDAHSPSPEPFSNPSTPQTRRGSADVLIRATTSQRNSLASFGHLVHAMEHTLYSDAGGELDDVGFNQETQRHAKRRTASSGITMLLDSEDEEEESTIYTGTTTESSTDSRRKPSQEQRHQVKSSKNKSAGATVQATSAVQAENLGYVWERQGDCVGLNFARSPMAEKVAGVTTAGTRCSVSEDVLAAWGSLGGWRDIVI
ncbi:hypothetical protein FKW77_005159 [Venturia effusa]|uniref:Uncharacterized protein n=1 Tax=Venturia effusa TaxID=50376 RepID=A0A517LH53_9PEZI|nr:hypothetical protein FKW77_005159 [Venturia effusa]